MRPSATPALQTSDGRTAVGRRTGVQASAVPERDSVSPREGGVDLSPHIGVCLSISCVASTTCQPPRRHQKKGGGGGGGVAGWRLKPHQRCSDGEEEGWSEKKV